MISNDLIKKTASSYYPNLKNFHEIKKGVMNFKYQFTSNDINYIIRCYPKGHESLAAAEYNYISKFKEKGIKVPDVKYFSEEPFPFLIYKKLEGHCLDVFYNQFDDILKKNLRTEIYENYCKISNIESLDCGPFTSFNRYKKTSWKNFLSNELTKSFNYLFYVKKTFNPYILHNYVYNFLDKNINNCNKMVWTDFNPDNIIVNTTGNLIGFIDFEGLLGGDPLMGIGYLQARYSNTLFFKELYSQFDLEKSKDIIDFYSIIRYLRLVPYENTPLPNSREQRCIESFLPYSLYLINNICNG